AGFDGLSNGRWPRGARGRSSSPEGTARSGPIERRLALSCSSAQGLRTRPGGWRDEDEVVAAGREVGRRDLDGLRPGPGARATGEDEEVAGGGPELVERTGTGSDHRDDDLARGKRPVQDDVQAAFRTTRH